MISIEFSENYAQGSLIVFSFADQELSSSAKLFDEKSQGALNKALQSSKFTGKVGEIISINSPQNLSANRLICIGLGKKEKITTHTLQKVGAIIAKTLKNTKEESINIIFDDSLKLSCSHIGFGILLGSYKFDIYKTETTTNTFEKAIIITKNADISNKEFKDLKSLAKGIYTARDFVSEPANILTPAEFAKRTEKIMKKIGVKTEIYDEKFLKTKGMNLINAVSQASSNKPRLVVISYNGAKDKNASPIALVGKGLCYDSGGLSLKPSTSMATLKQDMAGGAAVIGAIQALALQKAAVNIIGIIPMVENSISGNSYRPGDVIKSYSGKTVEIYNTDAEGRLVLADALTFAQEFKPKAVINLATLTGAIVSALGNEYAGLFSNNDELATNLTLAGTQSNEKVWRFPIDNAYEELLKSDIADFNHMGKTGAAGSIVAACFLNKFIEKNIKWAHLDIAGVAYLDDKSNPLSPSKATGFGVNIINTLILNSFVQ